MKKLFFCIMVISIILPELSWGEDPYDETLKYIPRTVATGDLSTLDNNYGEIARYRYNPIIEKWEFEADKATIKYNHVQDEWTYAYPGEILRFNSVENDWDYQFPGKRIRFDMITEKWFYGYAPPEKQLKYKELPPPGITR